MVPWSDSEDGKTLRILGEKTILAYLVGPTEPRGPSRDGRRMVKGPSRDGRRTVKGGKVMCGKKQSLKDVLPRWREGQRAEQWGRPLGTGNSKARGPPPGASGKSAVPSPADTWVLAQGDPLKTSDLQT